jgi:hypothetical protein
MTNKVLLVDKKVLVVEGRTEVFVIPYLIEANGVNWGKGKNTVVHIKDYDGYTNISETDAIATELLASGLTALGIIIDADEEPKERWQSIRNACQNSFTNGLPKDLPENGLICNAPNEVKFGIWMMPDNQMRGILETFLAYMIPDTNESLWKFAQQSTQEATNQGANFTEFQRDKANIYTWLAWQNPPGQQLHQAIDQKIFDPKHPRAQKFVTWFKELYGL